MGRSVIHHSKRPLLQNYYNFTHIDDEKTRERDLFSCRTRRSRKPLFYLWGQAWNSLFLPIMTWIWWPKLSELVEHGFTHWKLEGIYTPGQNFVEIAKCFVKARELLEAGTFTFWSSFPIGRTDFTNCIPRIVSLTLDFMTTIQTWLNKGEKPARTAGLPFWWW